MTNEKRPERGVQLYPDFDVRLTYQNFGSTWLCILRGESANIERVFNGLYNYRATNGDYSFFDHAETVATFWSDYRSLRRFFFNRYWFPRSDNLPFFRRVKLAKEAMRYALNQIAELRANGHEFFMDFSVKFEPVVHTMGTTNAENPDADFKDAVLTHAFKDKAE